MRSRLITTKALAFIDSKVPRSVSVGLAYFDYDNDGDMDLYVANNSQPNALYLNKGNGTFQDVTATVGLSPGNQVTTTARSYLNNSAGLIVRGSIGTTENFMRIGHSLFALIAAFVGGQLSRRLYARNGNGWKDQTSQRDRPHRWFRGPSGWLGDPRSGSARLGLCLATSSLSSPPRQGS